MAYNRVNWENGEEGGTPTSADNFNTMDRGIADAHDRLDRKPDHSDIPDAPDLSDYVTQEDVDESVQGKADREHQHEAQDISDSSAFSRGLIRTQDAAGARAHLQAAAASDIPDVSDLATQEYVDNAVGQIDVPDVSGLASQADLEALEARIAALESAGTGE